MKAEYAYIQSKNYNKCIAESPIHIKHVTRALFEGDDGTLINMAGFCRDSENSTVDIKDQCGSRSTSTIRLRGIYIRLSDSID
jgi:hypothetical protein